MSVFCPCLTTSRLLVTFTSCFFPLQLFHFLPHKHTGHLGNYEVRWSSVWVWTPPCLALISIKTPGESKDANVHDNCKNLARNCHCKISQLLCPLNILPQILNWSFWQLQGLHLERCSEINRVILSPLALCWRALSRDKSETSFKNQNNTPSFTYRPALTGFYLWFVLL